MIHWRIIQICMPSVVLIIRIPSRLSPITYLVNYLLVDQIIILLVKISGMKSMWTMMLPNLGMKSCTDSLSTRSMKILPRFLTSDWANKTLKLPTHLKEVWMVEQVLQLFWRMVSCHHRISDLGLSILV